MLHINGLTCRLGERLLIDGATAALPSGARVGLVGRNGAGKTTLFRLIRGDLSPESGAISVPKGARLGSVEQEAPGGAETLIDFVLAADVERAALIAEAESASDPERIADIQTRLVDIDAHSAPARAARILSGLGFDEAAQNRALSEYSGGWRMRVALAAMLFSEPDLLLLDEPTNYLDLEGVLWLTDYLKSCPSTILVISHDRDLLDDIADHILHLDRAKLTLWSGGYTSFERQRRESQALQGKTIKKQEERRAHLQAFVDRFRASAAKAAQAQSRLKMLARMEPIAAVVDEAVHAVQMAADRQQAEPADRHHGEGQRRLRRADGAVAHRPDPLQRRPGRASRGERQRQVDLRKDSSADGLRRWRKMVRANKLDVGFFAQHQIDDLEPGGTPYSHVAGRMRGEPEAKIRGRAATIGFSGARADTKVEQLSGGEKARLLMGLATFERAAAPHSRRTDQPSRHRQSRRAHRSDQRLRGRLHPRLARPALARDLRRPAVAGGERDGEALRRRPRRLRPLRIEPGRAGAAEGETGADAEARAGAGPQPRPAAAEARTRGA